MLRTSRYIALVAVILWAGAWTVARGQAPQPGTLEPTFGKGGVAAFDVSSHWIRKLAIQDVTLGSAAIEERIVATSGTSWVLARHLPNGALDTTFGAGGVVTKTFRKGNGSLNGVAVQPGDQRIVVAGTVPVTIGRNTVSTLAVARYNSNGTDDTTFGAGGLATIMVSPYGSWPNDIALQSDGKIVVVGRANASDGSGYLFAVRLLLDGRLDGGFGTGGVFTYSHPSTGRALTTAYAVAVHPGDDASQERILITATGQESSSPYVAVTLVVRLTANGWFDNSFGDSGTGMTRLAIPDADETHVSDIAIDADKRIVAAGKAYYGLDASPTGKMFLARYLENGIPDSYFGNGGTLIRDSVDEPSVSGLAIQPNDGAILVAGGVAVPPQGFAAVWRFLPDGSLDATFGTNGLATASSAQFWGIALSQKPDGTNKFLVGGRVFNPKNNKSYWTLWCYFY